jgi:rubrerythrin
MADRSFPEIERDRLTRKIERLGQHAVAHEQQAAALYKQIAFLCKEIYKLERAITAQEAQA